MVTYLKTFAIVFAWIVGVFGALLLTVFVFTTSFWPFWVVMAIALASAYITFLWHGFEKVL